MALRTLALRTLQADGSSGEHQTVPRAVRNRCPLFFAAAGPNEFRADALFRKEDWHGQALRCWGSATSRNFRHVLPTPRMRWGRQRARCSRTTSTVGVCSQPAACETTHWAEHAVIRWAGPDRVERQQSILRPTKGHSAVRKAWSKRAHRTQSRRSRSTPAACPDSGSKASRHHQRAGFAPSDGRRQHLHH